MMDEERLEEMRRAIVKAEKKIAKENAEAEVVQKKRHDIIMVLAKYIRTVPNEIKPPKTTRTVKTEKRQSRRWFRRNTGLAPTITKIEHTCPECGAVVSDEGYGGFVGIGYYLYLHCDCGWEYARLGYGG